jgi:signal transduction histidine kinase
MTRHRTPRMKAAQRRGIKALHRRKKNRVLIEAEQTGTLTEQQLLIYAQELNDLHHQQRQQFLVLQKLYADLQAKERVRAQLLAQLLSAQEQERKRIAREIHDSPLQDLGVLLLSLERCKRQLDAGLVSEAQAGMVHLRSDVQQMVSVLRSLVTDLRPPLLDTSGLLGALDYLAGRLGREAGVTIHVSSRTGARLDPTLELVIFRLVQESLANIRKHAKAQHAWIWMERQGDKLHLEVRDDGQGFAVQEHMREALATGHIGLASMAERAEAAGGKLTIESTPTQGTVLRFVLPFRAAAESEAPPEPAPPQESEPDASES